MIPPHLWHPLVVHFPLALVVTGTLVLTAAGFVRSEPRAATLATVGTWNLILGALGAVLALATGLAAVSDVQVDAAARQAVGLHVKWAVLASVLLLLLAVWRSAGQVAHARPSRLYLVMLWLMTAALIMAGFRGEQNVYRYAVGVAPERNVVGAPGSPP